MALDPNPTAAASPNSGDGGFAVSRAEAQYRKLKRQSMWEISLLMVFIAVARIGAWQTADYPQYPLVLWLLPLVFLVAGYFGLSIPALREENRRLGLVFMVICAAVAIALGWVHLDFSVAGVLILVAFESFWFFVKRTQALAAVAAWGAVVIIALIAIHGLEHERMSNFLVNMGVNALIGTALAVWVTADLKHNLANAKLVDELQAAQTELAAAKHAEGVTAERQRVAREIHDTLAQGYTTILMQTQAADRALNKGDLDKVRERHGVVVDVARANLAEARSLVAAFAPAPLQEQTLAEALTRMAARWSNETGIPCEVKVDDVGAMSADQDVVLLRTAQEALTNVAKHSGATQAKLRLGGRRDLAVRLVVEDNGTGIPSGTPDGYGLQGMRARVAEVGGTLTVDPSPTGGTIVRVTLSAKEEPL